MKATDKTTVLRILQSANPSDIEVKTIARLDPSSTRNAMDRMHAFVRSKSAGYMIIAVRLR